MITNIEQKITDIIQETIKNLGFEIVRITVKGAKVKILEILIDRLDGEKVSLKDCKTVNRNISVLLDIENVFDDKYNLEISSAGAERPLISLENYARFIGSEVQIRLKELLNNCGHYRGTILKVQENIIILKLNKTNEQLHIRFEIIKNGHLVMTDEMFRKLLNKKS